MRFSSRAIFVETMSDMEGVEGNWKDAGGALASDSGSAAYSFYLKPYEIKTIGIWLK